jgi:hypothetical protein
VGAIARAIWNLAWFEVDELVPVVYDPALPQRAYVEDIRGFWKMPLALFIGAGVAWFAAMLWR